MVVWGFISEDPSVMGSIERSTIRRVFTLICVEVLFWMVSHVLVHSYPFLLQVVPLLYFFFILMLFGVYNFILVSVIV
jgi:hypothetical protein